MEPQLATRAVEPVHLPIAEGRAAPRDLASTSGRGWSWLGSSPGELTAPQVATRPTLPIELRIVRREDRARPKAGRRNGAARLQGPRRGLVHSPRSGSRRLRDQGVALHVIPLHGSLPAAQQRRAFAPPPKGARKVVVRYPCLCQSNSTESSAAPLSHSTPLFLSLSLPPAVCQLIAALATQ